VYKCQTCLTWRETNWAHPSLAVGRCAFFKEELVVVEMYLYNTEYEAAEEERVCMQVRAAGGTMLCVSDRAGHGASNEVRLVPTLAREEEFRLADDAGTQGRRCKALLRRCCMMTVQRG
jgi:hypothetical protein